MNLLTQITHITPNMLKSMEEKVLNNRPQLKLILEQYGNLSYFEYVKHKNRISLNKDFKARKNETVDVIKEETSRLLGSVIAEDLERQLKKNDSISTAEHTTSLATTNAFNSALHLSLPLFSNSDPKYHNILVLSCAGISFNNESSFSRGLEFHAFKNQQITGINLAFFGRSVDSNSVIYSPAYTGSSVSEMQKKLNQLFIEGTIDKKIVDQVESLLNKVYLNPHVMSQKNYIDQLSITNYHLWKKLFPSFQPEAVPNYVMLSQENILINLLLKFHLNQNTLIHNFLFNKQYHDLIEKYFDGITGAFNKQEGSGTFLFWGYSKKSNTRIQLFRQNNKLVSLDGSFSLSLEPTAVQEAILNNDIFPSLLLTFVVLSFYYGLILGGWTSQTDYLSKMKTAFINLLKETGDLNEEENVASGITEDLVIPRPHLAFLDAYNQRLPATGLDMYMYQNPDQWKSILQASKTITLHDVITIMLPSLYKKFCPEEEKEDSLMQIDSQAIQQFTEFDKKIPSIGIIV